MTYDVAVLIVTYNSAQQIGGCLDSLLKEQGTLRQQIIVLDNHSHDDTVEIVKQFPQANVLQAGVNLGFAAGVNRAAIEADAEFLLLLNPDTIVLRHAVERLTSFARDYPGYGLYGGRAYKTDGSLEPSSCWGLPTLWSLLMFATGLSTLAKRNPFLDPESLGGWKRDSVRSVGMISGAFLLIRRSLWKRLRGFDERFFMYGEDADLAARARALGLRSIVCPSATFVHEVGKSAETPLHKAVMLYRGKTTYIKANWPKSIQRIGLFLLLAGVALRSLGSEGRTRIRHKPGDKLWTELWHRRREWTRGYQE